VDGYEKGDLSAGPDGWTRSLVSSVICGKRVDVDKNARLVASIDARNRDRVGGLPAATADYIDLCTADVELGALVCPRQVKSNLLDADEVLTAWSSLWNGECNLLYIFR